MLGRLSGETYAVLRIVAGFVFLAHGLQKTAGLFGGTVVDYTSLFGVAGVIEVIGGVLLMLGMLTVPAAFIASGEMAAAYFIAHAPKAFWPIQNGGELAVVLCFLFLYIAARGPGIWSVDGLIRTRPVKTS